MIRNQLKNRVDATLVVYGWVVQPHRKTSHWKWRRRTSWYRGDTGQDLLLRRRDMGCTYLSVWKDHLSRVSTTATSSVEALSLGSPWKRNRSAGIIPPNRSTIFHRPKGDKFGKWEKTSVGNGMWIYPRIRRVGILLLPWWIRTVSRVLNTHKI